MLIKYVLPNNFVLTRTLYVLFQYISIFSFKESFSSISAFSGKATASFVVDSTIWSFLESSVGSKNNLLLAISNFPLFFINVKNNLL